MITRADHSIADRISNAVIVPIWVLATDSGLHESVPHRDERTLEVKSLFTGELPHCTEHAWVVGVGRHIVPIVPVGLSIDEGVGLW